MTCPPRYGTPRNSDRPTLGPRVAQVAAALGQQFMPWQRHVADVALEVDPDTGLLAYRRVDLVVPRRSGKTTLDLAVMVHRARAWAGQWVVFTSSSRNHARKKLVEEHIPTLDRSVLAGYTVRLTNGSESVRWVNGSHHSITSTRETAGHGDDTDLVVVDEAWVHEDHTLEQGLRPTQITRAQPQYWTTSSAGTERSVYLRGKVDAGRTRVAAGTSSSTAFFEWSAPGDVDPGDPKVWRATMPALGHTVAEDVIRDEFESMDLPEFCRAYLCWWPSDMPTGWQVIPEDLWAARADLGSQIVGRPAFAVDTNPERTWSSIAVAGLTNRSGGGGHVEVVDHRRGTGWVVSRVRELVERWDPCAVVIDPGGPAASLVADLEAAGVELTEPTVRDHAAACGAIYDAVCGDEPSLWHMGQTPLNAAVAGAQRRVLGDAWLWARKGPSVDISPLVAVTLAAWGHAVRGWQPTGPQVWVFN